MHFTIKSLLRLFPWQKTIFTLSYVQLLKCIKGKVLSIHKGVNSFCCSPLRLIQISGKLNFFQLSDVTIYNCFTRPAVSVRVKLYLFKPRHVWIENWICSQQSEGQHSDKYEAGDGHTSSQTSCCLQCQVCGSFQFLIFLYFESLSLKEINIREIDPPILSLSLFSFVFCVREVLLLRKSTKYFVCVPSVRHGCNTHIKPRGLTAMSGTLHPQYQVINEKNKAEKSYICETLVFLDYYDVLDYIEKCDWQTHSLA